MSEIFLNNLNSRLFFFLKKRVLDERKDTTRRTDGWTDERAERWTSGRTKLLSQEETGHDSSIMRKNHKKKKKKKRKKKKMKKKSKFKTRLNC